eukprot:1159741-Pelagomonas_calceolata.AAC.15
MRGSNCSLLSIRLVASSVSQGTATGVRNAMNTLRRRVTAKDKERLEYARSSNGWQKVGNVQISCTHPPLYLHACAAGFGQEVNHTGGAALLKRSQH